MTNILIFLSIKKILIFFLDYQVFQDGNQSERALHTLDVVLFFSRKESLLSNVIWNESYIKGSCNLRK